MDASDSANRLTLSSLHKFVADEHRSELPSTPKSLPTKADEGKIVSDALYAEYAMRVIAAYCRSMKDALNLYVPRPSVAAFHESNAQIRLLNGPNQSGKSAAAMVEFARIVRGKDPYKKMPERNLITMTVGKDQLHIGQVVWRKLWFPGAFDIVPDEITGAWRTVRPDPNDPLHLDPIDMERKHLWHPSPPLLPPDCFARPVVWENKGEGVPSMVEFKTGTQSWFHTSNGSPRAGVQIDLALLDEEIDGKRWLPELFPRLVRRNGRLIWDYTPEESTAEAYELYLRAVNGDPDVAAFSVMVADNPYYSDEAKAALYKNLATQGPDVLAAKWFGQHVVTNRIVYPEYSDGHNGIDARELPTDWMRVAAIDPGTACSVAVFGAVPPDADRLEVYGELLVRNSDAGKFAREFRRMTGNRDFEVYVIDKQAGQQRTIGRTNTVADHYAEAFRENGVPDARQMPGSFVYGSNDVEARELSCKSMLSEGVVRFHRGRTSRLIGQIQSRLRDKRNPRLRERRMEHDLCDAFEYLCAFFDDKGIFYRPPRKQRIHDLSGYGRRVVEAFEKDSKSERRRPLPTASEVASSY